jgi:hypothetical protein
LFSPSLRIISARYSGWLIPAGFDVAGCAKAARTTMVPRTAPILNVVCEKFFTSSSFGP